MTALVKREESSVSLVTWNRDQIELIKRTICKGATDDQLKLFEHVCNKTGLDPFMKQIYGIMRNSKDAGPQMTIQTSIDGLRLIADRTGDYLPSDKENEFIYDKEGNVLSAKVYIKKFRKGEWHEIVATAIMSEYKPKPYFNNKPNEFWEGKPHIMLAKCAEALALRKAFPAEMSGVYIKEELDQANFDNLPMADAQVVKKEEPIKAITQDQTFELEDLLAGCSEESKKNFNNFLKINRLNDMQELPETLYQTVKLKLIKSKAEHENSLLKSDMKMEGSVHE